MHHHADHTIWLAPRASPVKVDQYPAERSLFVKDEVSITRNIFLVNLNILNAFEVWRNQHENKGIIQCFLGGQSYLSRTRLKDQ